MVRAAPIVLAAAPIVLTLCGPAGQRNFTSRK